MAVIERLSQVVKAAASLTPASRGSGDYSGAAVDTSGFDAVAMLVDVGVVNTATLDVKLQHSDDGSTDWDDIPGAAIVQRTSANDDTVLLVDVRMGGVANKRRYVRAEANVNGLAAVFGVSMLLYQAAQVPVVNAPAAVVV